MWAQDPKMEYVGDLGEVVAVLVQSNLAFLTYTELCLLGQIVSNYLPLFLTKL